MSDEVQALATCFAAIDRLDWVAQCRAVEYLRWRCQFDPERARRSAIAALSLALYFRRALAKGEPCLRLAWGDDE